MWYENFRRTPERGFTLLEILVALTVFALISTVAYSGLSRMHSNKAHLDSEMRFWRELDQIMGRMEADFLQTLPDSLSYIGSAGDAMEPPLLRLQHFDSKQQLLSLAYQLRGQTLELTLWQGGQSRVFTLLDGISDCRFSFMDASGQWQGKWEERSALSPLANTSPRPRGICLELTLAGRGSFERIFFIP